MACCYIAASFIAFIIRSCDALDINLHLQYNESVEHAYADDEEEHVGGSNTDRVDESGVTVVSITGMTCAACTATVEAVLKEVKGVNEALVSLPLQEARLLHDEGVRKEDIVKAVESIGYDAVLGERAAEQKIKTLQHTEELATLRNSLKGLSIYSAIIFTLGTLLDYSDWDAILDSALIRFGRPVALFALTSTAAAKHGNWILGNAVSAARHWRVNMHTLITASTIVGLSLTLLGMVGKTVYSDALYHDTILGVLLIITVGRYMDLLSRRRATDTFSGLYSLLDQTASVKLAKLNKRVPTSIVRSGDEIIIDSFNIIPCDAYVTAGKSHVNESVITGESLPKIKEEGELLLAGSRNGPGQLHARVNQDFQGSFLAQLIRSVENSLSTKVSVQHRIDVITQYFVSGIFSIAIPTSIFTLYKTLLLHGSYMEAFDVAGRRLMTILAAACPCALGLATPCAVMAGIDVSWRRGILMLEGGETMERLRSITHIVMDKTGTLTRGTLSVTDMSINGRWKGGEDLLATLIAAAEEQGMAAHPLAMAIFRRMLPMSGELWAKYQDVGAVRKLSDIGGRGIVCDVNPGDGLWRAVCVGNLAWMKENGIKSVDSLPLDVDKEGSAVFVGVDGDIAASMVLNDVVRPDAKATIDALKSQGLQLSMLTGDQPAEACRISKELGIPVLDSAATPDVKLEHIKSIQDKGGKVLMIGDGMNDGPSLANASVGVMMSNGRKCLTSGGSVLLLQPQLDSILTLLDISRKTMQQVSTNIWWAVTYNTVAVALAIGLGAPIGIHISPPVAAAMMSVSSLFITVQGLLLRGRLGLSDKEQGLIPPLW
ncbi:heavy metal translocatin [Massarina eburnea CBS 473.64]|uniref:Heavy metal translocatin n=1 Tax=Massarina eburnea CBS 473.64 TaxID=1395130 RepID=A0A6A6RIU6_9PLEO|nr:heavy metal translocatin [Massarina eburnea CBS 473.64]